MELRVEYLDYKDTIKEKNAIAVLGFFDGLHLAHQVLFEKGQQIKQEKNLPLIVFTFDQSIALYLNNKPFYYLTSVEDKVKILEAYDVDVLYVFNVSKPFISLEPDEFINKYLLSMSYIVVGYDFSYGFRSLGKVEHLRKYKEFEALVLDEIQMEDKKIGSSRIRQALDQGDIDLANALLGRPYAITGKVIKGKGLGKVLGYPTANLDFTSYYLPKKGVYYTIVIIDGKKYNSLTNVGKKPTFNDSSISLEAFIMDLEENLYGKYITIEFISFMRDEIKFDNKARLIEAIQADVEHAKDLISKYRKEHEN